MLHVKFCSSQQLTKPTYLKVRVILQLFLVGENVHRKLCSNEVKDHESEDV